VLKLRATTSTLTADIFVLQSAGVYIEWPLVYYMETYSAHETMLYCLIVLN